MEGDESGEVASKVHDAFHAIKQIHECNDDNDDEVVDHQAPMSHITMIPTSYDVIEPTAYDPSQRVGHMNMSLSTTNSATNSKGSLTFSLLSFTHSNVLT